MTSSISPRDLKIFQIIHEFVDNIYELYGDIKIKSGKIHALNLYHRLLVNVQFKDNDIMAKHVHAFKNFCIANREAIEKRNWKAFTTHRVEFSEKIYVDIYWIFQKSLENEQVTGTCWEYILTMSALLDENSDAKNILQNLPPQVQNNPLGSLMDLLPISQDVNQLMPKLIQCMPLLMNLSGIVTKVPQTQEDVYDILSRPEIKSITKIMTNNDITDDIAQLISKFFIKMMKFQQDLQNETDKEKRIILLNEIIDRL